MQHRPICVLFALLHACGSSPDSSLPPRRATTCEPGLDAGASPAQPEREALCDGPFVQRPSGDSCYAVHPSWDTRSDVATVEACFALCADSPLCRETAAVQYNPATESCILDASCSPEAAGFHEYVASGGCAAPKQCWAWKETEDPDACAGDPGGYSYFEAESIDDCILRCEKYPRVCGDHDRVDFDPVTGKCMTDRPYGCLLTSLGFVEYEYHEIPCE